MERQGRVWRGLKESVGMKKEKDIGREGERMFLPPDAPEASEKEYF